MEHRLLAFLNAEKLNSSRFADMLGVQRSAISHILSGRNKPGFDFLVKIFEKFPVLNMEWLILGTGNMYKSAIHIQKSLFEEVENQNFPQSKRGDHTVSGTTQNEVQTGENIMDPINASSDNPIEKIIILYSDRSFIEYKAK